MKLNSRLLLVGFLTILVGIFSFTTVATNGDLFIKGSTTVLPIADRAAELFQSTNTYTGFNPNFSVTIAGGGSSTGIAALINGEADIANASRPMKDKELKQAAKKGVIPIEFAIAKDGIAIVVHSSNPVDELTFQQIADIYTGQITNWSEVGGPDLKVVAVSRDTTSGTYGSFMDMIIEEIKGKKARLSPYVIYTGSNAEEAETVAGAEGAIGHIGMAYISEETKVVKVSKDGETFVKASLAAVIDGSYPVSRSLYMYVDGKETDSGWEPAKPVIAGWLDFIFSYTGQCIALEQGYVPLIDVDIDLCKYLFEGYGAEFIEE